MLVLLQVTFEVYIYMDVYLEYYFPSIGIAFLLSTSVYGLILAYGSIRLWTYIHDRRNFQRGIG